MESINKIRFGSLERPKIKNEKHTISTISSKKGDISTNHTVIKNSQQDIVKFVENHNLPKLIQEKVEYLKSFISIKEAEFTIKQFSQINLHAYMASLPNFSKY